ncbi:MAG: hypothetical protein QOG04_2011 [Actinomycetota bacterium]|jgi:plastocyanin|nr:hypothetical protein [Actinomycetota bacterium]
MRRFTTLFALALIASALLVAAPSTAGAGGFCAGGKFTDVRNTSKVALVEIRNYCFTPTIMRIEPGDQVTFQNSDPDIHALGGVQNIFGDMHTEIMPKESLTYTFRDEGVFPYLCILHPGMAGAIVVGDGEGKNVTRASIVESSAVLPGSETSDDDSADVAGAAAQQPDTTPASSNTSGSLWQLLGILGAVAGTFWWTRRKPQTEI